MNDSEFQRNLDAWKFKFTLQHNNSLDTHNASRLIFKLQTTLPHASLLIQNQETEQQLNWVRHALNVNCRAQHAFTETWTHLLSYLVFRLITFQEGFTDFINGNIKRPQQNCNILRLLWIKHTILLIQGGQNLSPSLIFWCQTRIIYHKQRLNHFLIQSANQNKIL